MFAARLFLRSHANFASWRSTYVVSRTPSVLFRAFHSSPIVRSIADMVEKVHTTERLTELRKLMKEHQIDVYSTGGPSNVPQATD